MEYSSPKRFDKWSVLGLFMIVGGLLYGGINKHYEDKNKNSPQAVQAVTSTRSSEGLPIILDSNISESIERR